MNDVFISYSSKEFGAAAAVRAMLVEKGISCWMAPDSIPGGSNYTKEIPVAIRSCRVFVLILSKNAQSSHWVLKELDAAVSHGKVILPFMLENFTLSDEFSFLLSGTQWYPAYLDADAELDKMVERIKSITADSTPQKRVRKPRPAPKPAEPAPKPEPRPAPEPQPEPVPLMDKKPVFACPACGGTVVQPLKSSKKSYDIAESARFLFVLPAVILAVFASLLAVALLDGIIWAAAGIVPDFLVVVFSIFVLASIPVGASFGMKTAKENIRRRRVRKHIRAWGVQCRGCAKKFRVTVPFGTAFPWEEIQ